VAGGSIWAGIVVAVYLALFYPAVMRREERELSAKYGEDFARYAAEVPLFWPALRRVAANDSASEKFSGELYRRNREYQAALGFVVGIAILWARMRWLP